MKRELQELVDGVINFNTFERRTHTEWVKLAQHLFVRYPMPAGVELADVVQEIVMSAWRAVQSYDASRGSDLTSYVTWTAYAGARRWANEQRNSYRRGDHVPGRYPIPESHVGVIPCESDDASSHQSVLETTIVFSGNTVVEARLLIRDIVRQLPENKAIAFEAWLESGDRECAAAKLRSSMSVNTDRLVRSAIANAVAIAERSEEHGSSCNQSRKRRTVESQL